MGLYYKFIDNLFIQFYFTNLFQYIFSFIEYLFYKEYRQINTENMARQFLGHHFLESDKCLKFSK